MVNWGHCGPSKAQQSLFTHFVQVCLQNMKTLEILHLGLEICPFWALYYLAQEFRKAHAATLKVLKCL